MARELNPMKKSEYKKLQTRLDKLKYKKIQMEKKNPELTSVKINSKINTIQKINAINLLIGYIVRKGLVSELPIDTLKEIADDYEKRLEENE